MKSFYRFLKSVTVGVVLILFITLFSILSTFVRQGQDLAFYYHEYSPAFAWLIVNTGFNDFFSSILFLVPSALFFINLSVCTVDRFATRLRAAKKRYGPDIVHLGLLLLILGGILTATARREGQVWMAVGDEIRLTEEISLVLRDYRFIQYSDGRPKDWISTVDVTDGKQTIIDDFAIEVNRPLKIKSLKVFQASYSTQSRAEMTDADGNTYTMREGESFRDGDRLMLFVGVSGPTAYFEEWEGHTRKATLPVLPDTKIGPYTVAKITTVDITGLTVTDDPGYSLVLLALIMITGGLALTYIQKIGDNKI